ncbi:helix-turn-helix transcriptional regulator [Alishewanella sp. HL-SH05]|uniref:helix-turn-helix transcriptional regulator n=1 Tax=Alishewanella sp. HL-SH05 TaxID=3461145 RepID=UPI004042517E
MTNRLLTLKQISELVGLSRASIWRLRTSGDFPKGISLTRHSIRWSLADIEEWLNSKKIAA